MAFHVVSLHVTAGAPIDCDFWSEGYSWKGFCKILSRVPRPLAGENSIAQETRSSSRSASARAYLALAEVQEIQAALPPIEGKVWWIDGKVFWGLAFAERML
jgi:hypothetical protein